MTGEIPEYLQRAAVARTASTSAAILSAMPPTQDKNGSRRDFISQLIISDEDPSNFTWFVSVELLPETRVIKQPTWSPGKLLDHPRGSVGRNRLQMFE